MKIKTYYLIPLSDFFLYLQYETLLLTKYSSPTSDFRLEIVFIHFQVFNFLNTSVSTSVPDINSKLIRIFFPVGVFSSVSAEAFNICGDPNKLFQNLTKNSVNIYSLSPIEM